MVLAPLVFRRLRRRERVLPALGALVIATTALVAAAPACSNGAAGERTFVTFTVTDTPDGENTPVTIVGPATIEAGVVTLTLRNRGQSPHDAQILRVAGQRNARQIIAKTIGAKAGSRIPGWITGGAGVGTVQPGTKATVTQVLTPGTYYLLDSETAAASHRLHAYNGGVAKFTVVGGSDDAQLPETDATIMANEYTFATEGITRGRQAVTFTNVGEELHHVIIFPYEDGASAEVVERFFNEGQTPAVSPPVDRLKGMGTAVIDGGQSQIVQLTFRKGRYALVCFVGDRAGGPAHVYRGMVSELEVS